MSYPRSPRPLLVVDENLIREAKKRDSNHCMIAEAIKKAVPGAASIAVDLTTIRFSDTTKRVRYHYITPRVIQLALVNFDQGRGRKLVPFEVKLRGAHVTKMRNPAAPAAIKKNAKKRQRREAAKLRNEKSGGNVPTKVGGKAPPLQITSDGVPFSRRRAFGLRALEY